MFERVDLFGFENDFTERAFDICRFEFFFGFGNGFTKRRFDI